MARGKVNKWLRDVQSWIMPSICLLCGACGNGAADAGGLCGGCHAALPWQSAVCARCALPLTGGPICGHCLLSPPVQDETVCLFDYAPPVEQMIQRLKFNGDLVCARVLGGLMASALAARGVPLPQAIVPMPLHPTRLAARGFNQALELARPVARRLGVALDLAACVRVRATAEQSSLGAAQREANVRGAFAIRRPVAQDVAIVDDVATTGHTVQSLARLIRAAGTRRVSVWLCARAALSRP